MNVQVIFDSQFGNTKQLAQAISGKLAEGAYVKMTAADQISWQSLAGVDLLVMGSPTQRWRPTRVVKMFLEEIPKGSLEGIAMAAFDTRLRRPRLVTGSAAKSIAKKLQKNGGKLLLPPESFLVMGMKGPLVDGEIERAVIWTGQVLDRYMEIYPLSKTQRQ